VPNDRRLIEDYIPIRQISAEASREKHLRHGHISTLHVWWSRKPLTASRAAVYAALVPAPETPQERATRAKFMIDLCKWKVSEQTIRTARRHIMAAHAVRLNVAPEDDLKPMMDGKKPIPKGVPPPKVLDPFAGGGSMPLEALHLGCDAYAMDLNPVAYLILLCTCVYPQKYGWPNPGERGMTGPPGSDGNRTWGGLAEEVRYWGDWVFGQVKSEIADLYPPIPDPSWELTPKKPRYRQVQILDDGGIEERYAKERPFLRPIAYLWTHTVKCPNPSCGATVPLLRQTWLCRKRNRKVALRMVPDHDTMRVRFQVAEDEEIDFDPGAFSRRGSSTCPFCNATATRDYARQEGQAKRMGQQLMAIACTSAHESGKTYLAGPEYEPFVADESDLQARLEHLCQETGLTVPEELVTTPCHEVDRLPMYGMNRWCDAFSSRQLLALMTFTKWVRTAHTEALNAGIADELAKALCTCMAFAINKMADRGGCVSSGWIPQSESMGHLFAGQAIPMMWQYAEAFPLGNKSGSWDWAVAWTTESLRPPSPPTRAAVIARGSATALPYPDQSFDAVVTDPPYYDSVTYGDVSDFFYVLLKRSVGHLHPEHFAGHLAPKGQEAVAAVHRHESLSAARRFYEDMIQRSAVEMRRVLRRDAPLVIVYAHKTTAGWSSLVSALGRSAFAITGAWPLTTEMRARLLKMEVAALASTVFLTARPRPDTPTADYVEMVRPELRAVVRERVRTLMKEGITGADLVIACVGAGLRAYTQYSRVELPNGEELGASAYLDEVQREVLETVLEKVVRCDRQGIGGVDKATQYYVLGRYQYDEAIVDFDHANVLARGVGVELDAPNGLTHGRLALVDKQKNKVRLRNYRDRGGEEVLGLPSDDGNAAPIIDALHRLLWLLDNQAREIGEFLLRTQPNAAQLRLVAQSLAGRPLAAEPTPGAVLDTRTHEQHAIDRLLASWRNLVEQNLFTGSR